MRATPRSASARSVSVEFWPDSPFVRSPSAVAPTTVLTRQRHKLFDMPVFGEVNAVNANKRPSPLVRIEWSRRAALAQRLGGVESGGAGNDERDQKDHPHQDERGGHGDQDRPELAHLWLVPSGACLR